MKGMRIFKVDEDGIKEIGAEDDAEIGSELHETLEKVLQTSMVDYATDRMLKIASSMLMEYTCKNEDKMFSYLMSFDLGSTSEAASKIHSNLFKTVIRFILEYTKTLVNKCDSSEEADRLMVDAKADTLEFIDQHIDKQLKREEL
jgi:hypothetical protein